MGAWKLAPCTNRNMLIKTNDKWEALHAFINTWLKDGTQYCNICNSNFRPDLGPCCDEPQIGTNLSITTALIKQNREHTKTRRNQFATNQTKTMRWGVSLPPRLYHDANRYFKNHGYKGLFEDDYDLRNFMRKFKSFRIAESV